MIVLKPLGLKEASEYITKVHRHHKPPQGYKFAIGAMVDGELVGVATVGRPVARRQDDGFTAEVTRLATDGTPNACSVLYGACARAAKAMGYRTIITYTLVSEPGTSLRASNWVEDGTVKGASWSVPSRPRIDKHPTVDKVRWKRNL